MSGTDAKPLPLAQQLLHSTIRLECRNAAGQISSGTGIHFRFSMDGFFAPVIITNKHVLDGATRCTFYLTIADKDGRPTASHMPFEFNDFHKAGWISHPDPTVDLALLPIQVLLANLDKQHVRPFYIDLTSEIIPSVETLSALSTLEEVTIIGYPNGIWDHVNNRPIARRGITATACSTDYLGLPQFLVDAAIFPGSSGSPVFVFNQGSFANTNGGISIGSRLLFIGVVYAVHLHQANGEIKIIEAPTGTKQIALSLIPNNLGICIRSSKILEFESALRADPRFHDPATK